MAALDDEAFREALREVLARSGRSMRGLSAAMGRDPGYVAALLDPSRPSRARPNPADLLAASSATGLPFAELLAALWGIDLDQLAAELASLGLRGSLDRPAAEFDRDDAAALAAFADFLRARHALRVTRRPR